MDVPNVGGGSGGVKHSLSDTELTRLKRRSSEPTPTTGHHETLHEDSSTITGGDDGYQELIEDGNHDQLESSSTGSKAVDIAKKREERLKSNEATRREFEDDTPQADPLDRVAAKEGQFHRELELLAQDDSNAYYRDTGLKEVLQS